MSRADDISNPSETAERVAVHLWHRFAPEGHMEWEDEIHKAEYIDAANSVLILSTRTLRQALKDLLNLFDDEGNLVCKFDELQNAVLGGYDVLMKTRPSHQITADRPPFYGAECPSYPACSGGCGLGCTHEIEKRRAVAVTNGEGKTP